ncbi:MAG: hypothetical protein K6G11_03540, partial [Lachnospiraceae bacterium]|nr:hypothetical protein [Lachnospiraceae bacterium]
KDDYPTGFVKVFGVLEKNKDVKLNEYFTIPLERKANGVSFYEKNHKIYMIVDYSEGRNKASKVVLYEIPRIKESELIKAIGHEALKRKASGIKAIGRKVLKRRSSGIKSTGQKALKKRMSGVKSTGQKALKRKHRRLDARFIVVPREVKVFKGLPPLMEENYICDNKFYFQFESSSPVYSGVVGNKCSDVKEKIYIKGI